MARPSDVGVGVCVALVDHENSILMMERQGSHAAGTWAFPGGWIDRSDASLLEVVKREALEELGVTVVDAEQIGAVTEDHPDAGIRTVTIYYLATKWRGPIRIMEPNKCSQIRWCPLHQELPTPMFPGLPEGIELIKGRLLQRRMAQLQMSGG